MENLLQSERNSLFYSNYFFTITDYEIIDNNVFYLIRYGKSNNFFDNREIDYINVIKIRFSTLRSFNLCLNMFPSRTIFKHFDKSFLENRKKSLQNWITFIVNNSKAKEFYEMLEKQK